MKVTKQQYYIAVEFLEYLNMERYKERALVKVDYEKESAKEEYERIDRELQAINVLRCALDNINIE